MLSEQQAWAIADEVASAAVRCPIHGSLLAVYLVGSLPRGDFYPAKSEVDLLFLFRASASDLPDDDIVRALGFIHEIDSRWRAVTGRCFPCVDIGPWIRYAEIPFRPAADLAFVRRLATSPGRKYITTFAFDFVETARLLDGAEIRNELAVVSPRELVAADVSRLSAAVHAFTKPEDPDWALQECRSGYRVKCATMSVARTLYLAYGDRTLKKELVFRTFDEVVPDFGGKQFFSETLVPEYLDGRYLAHLSAAGAMAYIQGCLGFCDGADSLLSGARR